MLRDLKDKKEQTDQKGVNMNKLIHKKDRKECKKSKFRKEKM